MGLASIMEDAWTKGQDDDEGNVHMRWQHEAIEACDMLTVHIAKHSPKINCLPASIGQW